MTDPHPPEDPIDSIDPVDPVDLTASAAIDDTAADDLAPVDPVALARARAELQTGVELIATPVEPPAAEVRDRHIAAAVTARTEATGGEASGTDAPRPPTMLASRRRAQSARSILVRVAAVAAAVVVVALLGVALFSRSSSRSTETAAHSGRPKVSASAADTREDLGAFSSAGPLVARAAAAAAGTGPSGAPSTTVASAVPAHPPEAAATTAPTAAPTTTAPACDAPVRSLRPGLGSLVLDARAELAGTAVEVLVYEAPGGPSRVIAVVPGTCRVVIDRSS
jgi:hypothetical protein